MVPYLLLALPYLLIIGGTYLVTGSVGWAMITAGVLIILSVIAGGVVYARR